MVLGDRRWCAFCWMWRDMQEIRHECRDKGFLDPQRPSQHNMRGQKLHELALLQDRWDETHPDEAPCMYG